MTFKVLRLDKITKEVMEMEKKEGQELSSGTVQHMDIMKKKDIKDSPARSSLERTGSWEQAKVSKRKK